jgi:hypothetical protein
VWQPGVIAETFEKHDFYDHHLKCLIGMVYPGWWPLEGTRTALVIGEDSADRMPITLPRSRD